MPPQPSAPAKKSGCGCLGCGCAAVAVVALLFAALIGGIVYFAYNGVLNLTSAAPSNVATFDGGDTVYGSARQKIADFDHDVKNHQAATLELTADEINTLIAHDPRFNQKGMHFFVTMSEDHAEMQWSYPIALLHYHILQDRYLNGSTTFTLSFNSDQKMIDFDFQTLQVGDKVMIGGTDEPSASSFQQSFMRSFAKSFAPAFNKSFNQQLQKNPDAQQLLNETKTVGIKDGELVIETQ